MALRRVVWLALLLLWPASLSADDAAELRRRGAKRFREAEALLARKDPKAADVFRDAAEQLERAYTLEPRGEVRFNAAVAWDNAGEEARAADGFETALALGALASDYQKWASERLATLRTRLARIAVDQPVGGSVSVAHVRDGAIPIAFHLSPGTHRIDVRCPDGRRAETIVEAEAGQAGSVEPSCPAPVVKAAPPPPRPKRDEAEQPVSPLWVLGWIGVGVGAAAGATAIGLGVATLDARDDFEASGNSDAGILERGENLRLATNVCAFGGAVIGATGIVLIIVSVVSPGTASALDARGVTWRF